MIMDQIGKFNKNKYKKKTVSLNLKYMKTIDKMSLFMIIIYKK